MAFSRPEYLATMSGYIFSYCSSHLPERDRIRDGRPNEKRRKEMGMGSTDGHIGGGERERGPSGIGKKGAEAPPFSIGSRDRSGFFSASIAVFTTSRFCVVLRTQEKGRINSYTFFPKNPSNL